MLLLAATPYWQPWVRDYQYYTLIIEHRNNSNSIQQGDSYVALEHWINHSLQIESDVRLKLSEYESNTVNSIIAKIEKPHIIKKPDSKASQYCIRMKNVQVPFMIFYPTYFQVGTSIFSTSDNYSDIYKQLHEFLSNLNPATHIPDRPI
ncbi:hypothetical protein [Butyricicoccus faecihominis]|uniref:hypothetical protein n=1 Tax=Butyricicoccus faecihominis TaxID=1712515 RepID=UPI002479B83A|nr:hypothetical protein [Butyricicoccus faecihominis]